MPIPQVGERRSPVHRQNTLPPPSPRRGDMGTASAQESPSEIGRLIGRLSPRHKGKDNKDESGRFSALSSCDSPRQDDLDDYPFFVDDVDPPVSKPGSSDGKETSDQACSLSHKSQDAQVGSLVYLLRNAPPLRDHPSYSLQTSRAESSQAASASSAPSRRTSDALEELQAFKEIRERLQCRGSAKHQEPPGKP